MTKIRLVKTAADTLSAATPEDKELIAGLRTGQWVTVELKRTRNYDFHKKFFALLNLGFHYWTPGGGTISPEEQSYLSGFVRFLSMHVDHFSTIEEFSQAYALRTAERRAGGAHIEKSLEAFRKWATIEAGFYDEYVLPDMTKRREARSISFSKMGPDEFEELYKSVFNVLWNFILQKNFSTPAEAENSMWQLLEYER